MNNLFEKTLVEEFIYNFESPHTRRNYKNDLKSFENFINQSELVINNILDLERKHIVDFRNQLQEAELAPKTINRKLSSLSSFFDFLLEKNLIEFNPCHSVRRPRQNPIQPTHDLSDEQVFELLNSIDESEKSGLLHKVILTCLFYTGLRKSELTNLKIKDYYKKDNYYYFHIRAKGGKYLEKLLPLNCSELIHRYLAQRQAYEEDDHLFIPTKNPKNPSHLNKSLDPKSIYYIFKIYAKKCGFGKNISPHSARATFIGSALENGADLWKVAKDVGHASVRTTQDYNKRGLKAEDSPGLKLGYLKSNKR